MAYITNDGSRLIERARTEGKSIVFGSVRMNTIYKSDPYSLVQQTDEWFGENHGSVVGCNSHVSVDDVSQVCDSKLAVQCNDNSESWKSIGIYAHLDGEVDELLFACESIENGEYKDVTIVELPVTLDGVVADFGLSEGGSGGGGGGEVPANMMTTDTDQENLTGMKTWSWLTYEGQGTEDKPQEGDIKNFKILSIGSNVKGEVLPDPIVINSARQEFVGGGWQGTGNSITVLDANGVTRNDGVTLMDATWDNIIHAASRPAHVILSGEETVSTALGDIGLWDELIPASGSLTHDGIVFDFDESKHLTSVRSKNVVATISVRVFDDFISGNEVGVVNGVCDSERVLSFETPVALAKNYLLMWSFVRA